MFEDPIVDEIRAARQKHAAKFNFDLKKIAQDLREKQKESKRNIVSYSPKPANLQFHESKIMQQSN
ncbi:MAG: hypothetical protein HQK65_23305 [Desulfamplus sp.]|nr:hypothetical protein [Desulfamplus sp.]